MKKDTAHFKSELEKELKILEGELKSIARVNPENKNDWEAVPEKMDIDGADMNEAADGIESYEGNVAILDKLEPRYNEVNDALKRIKDGTFGTCSVCGKPIEDKRLEANPAATTCIADMK